MELQIPSNKIYNQAQTLNLNSSVMTFVGENGCGKSAILESIFKKYLLDTNSSTQLIAFSSVNNESFSSIFQNNFSNIQRLVVDDLNYTEEDENEEGASERIDKVINTMYFDPSWVRFLIFFSSSLKREGKVMEYLKQKDLVDVDENGIDITTHIGFPYRIRTYYNAQIIRAREEEAINPDHQSIRRTFLHQYLTKLTEHLFDEYDFDIEDDGARIVKTWRWFYAKNVPLVLGNDSSKIFSFLAWASLYDNFIFRNDCILRFKNNIELNQLSDGEHQLLAIYALMDLFDSDNTLFLLDEVDSHLYYRNIQKLWNVFGSISGKVITTTHSADSIILNEFSNIKLVEKGKIENDIVANKILDRLESLSAGGNYKLTIAGKVKYLALVEDYFDWFIFTELCKKKIADFDLNIMQQIHYIKCSSGFNSYADRFGNSKLDWIESFKKHNNNPTTKSIFLICDRDNLSINDVTDSGLVTDSQATGRKKTIKIKGNKEAYLMSWKRREIENYLLSHSMLSNHGKLDEVNHQLAGASQLQAGNASDNDGVRNLDVKTMLQPLYLKDGLASIPTDESGVDYNKLSILIAEIPADEISEDIVNVYDFIKGKI
jgi:hypothetical protein